MILAIDTGNTNTILGCVDEDNQVTDCLQLSTDRTATEYEYAAKIEQILALKGIEKDSFDGAIISSVVPPVTKVLAGAVEKLTGKKPLIVGAGVKTGMNIRIDDPGTVAADLVVTAVAVKEYYALPCVIIDMGTATTVTVVNKEGCYIGGVIMPGPGTSLKALVADTSLLPSIDFVAPKKAIASNTVDAMKGGIVFGSAGAVDGILDRYEEEMDGKPFTIVATGGLGAVIAPYCRHDILVDENLLLKGLGVIWQKNQKRR